MVGQGHFWPLGRHKGPVARRRHQRPHYPSRPHSQIQARASTLLTDLAYQAPPRGVVIPRAFSASAIWCSDLAPVRCISRITGSTWLSWMNPDETPLRLQARQQASGRCRVPSAPTRRQDSPVIQFSGDGSDASDPVGLQVLHDGTQGPEMFMRHSVTARWVKSRQTPRSSACASNDVLVGLACS